MEVSSMAEAMQHHAHLIKTARAGDDSLPLSKLLTFSALHPSGDLRYARAIFDTLPQPNSYCTNTMIRAYVKNTTTTRQRRPDDALRFFVSLQEHHPFAPPPDNFTYPFLLNACSRLRDAGSGRQLHGLAVKSGLAGSDRFVRNSLVHMYASCGQVECALKVFEGMREKDVVTWTSIIDGAGDGGRPVEAVRLFERMQGEEGVVPNDATLVSVLGACAEMGAMTVGREVHLIAERHELDSKTNVATALVCMYAKCGCIESAWRVFESMRDKDVFAWTAMISGLSSHGRCREAVDMFCRMRDEEMLTPDERTYTAVLCACRNAGWVAEGYRYFNRLKKCGTGGPKLQHYGCMVDLLARVGRLDEAEKFVNGMPMEPDAIIWRTLVWASKIHGDVDRAERLIKEHFLDAGSVDTGSLVLTGNVYASAGKWDEKAGVRRLMDKKKIEKPPGYSKIEVNGVIHEFESGDSSHPEAERIYAKWNEVSERLKGVGYMPKSSEVLLDMEDEEKAVQLHHHSEKLAVAFGLISTNPGDRILVVKNLRSCEDCHYAMKLVSKLYEREIVIRDRIRFHYFREGSCSCGDFW